jgi:ATP-dependent protease Clp ATPase subunit
MWFSRLRCSFCRRSDKEVSTLVAGARSYICDRCAHEAVRIMETTSKDETVPSRGADGMRARAADWNRTWHFSAATD